jgi:hypothetical protein
MKHAIDITAKQEVGLKSLADKYNSAQKTALTPTEYLSLITLSIIDEEVSRMDDDEVKALAAKFREASKTKRDQVKAILP